MPIFAQKKQTMHGHGIHVVHTDGIEMMQNNTAAVDELQLFYSTLHCELRNQPMNLEALIRITLCLARAARAYLAH